MIYVVDNGGEYSDHAIWFVEAGEWFPQWVAKVAEWVRRRNPRSTSPEGVPVIIASSEAFTWFIGEPATPEQFAGGWHYTTPHGNREGFPALPTAS
jgi:hypothetical protein